MGCCDREKPKANSFLPFSCHGFKINCGNGVILSLMRRLIASASFCISERPTGSRSSEIPKNRVPPIPLEKALTLFNQLLGFFVSRATLKSHSVASAISCSIIKIPPFQILRSFFIPHTRSENNPDTPETDPGPGGRCPADSLFRFLFPQNVQQFSGQWNWFVHSTPPSLLKYTTGARGTQRGIPMTKMTTENMNYVVCRLFTKI